MEYKNYCSCIFYALIEISLKMTWWRQRRRWMSRDRPRPTCCHRPRNLRREPIRHPENNSKQSLNLNLGQIVLFVYCKTFAMASLWSLSLDSRRHVLGKINELGTIFSTRQLFYSQNGQITDVTEKKNVPITFILPSRWQDDVESLGIETTGCLCFWP